MASLLAASLLLVSLGGATADANFVTQTVSTGQMTTDFNTTLTIAPFNSSLGKLTSVTISFSDSGNFAGTLTNNAAIPETFQLSENVHLNLTMGSTSILTDNLSASQTYTAMATGASAAFGAYNPSNTLGPMTFSSGTVFNTFQNSTTGLVVNLSTLSTNTMKGGGGNVSSLIRTTAGATITVTYNYTPTGSPSSTGSTSVPEPSSLIMTALGGLAALAPIAARRKRAA